MKNKKLFFFVLVLTVFSSIGQNFQKSFGRVFGETNTDQQELQGILNYDNESIIVSGTFRNVNTFSQIAFYGTLSSVNKNGIVNWHKGFLPTDYVSFDSLFLPNLIKTNTGDLYTFGPFFSDGQNSGYILMKFDANGILLFSKKINDALADFDAKLIWHENYFYGVMGSRIVKLDSQGNSVATISNSSLTFRDIIVDNLGNIVVVGDYNSSDPTQVVNTGLPVIRLTQDLNFVNGGIFYSDSLGSLYAHSVVSNPDGSLIIGGASIYLSVDFENEIKWVKQLPNFASLPASDTYNSIYDLKRGEEGTVFFVTNGFFSDSDNVYEPLSTLDGEDFQHYTAICEINTESGIVLNSSEIKNGFFNTINHFEVKKFIFDDNNLFAAGSIRDFYGEYKLNYIHKTVLDGLNCGESNRVVNVSDVSQEVLYIPLPSDTFSNNSLQINSISMEVVDIIVNYENLSCTESLSTDQIIQTNFVVYPNPANNIIIVEGLSNIINIRVVDSLGRFVMALESQSSNQYDVSLLLPGVYYLEIESDDKVFYKKLLKN